MATRRFIATVLIAFVTLASPASLIRAHAQFTQPILWPSERATVTSCQAILTRAMASIQSACSAVARNNACYGNANVLAQPSSGTTLKFDNVGDQAAIRSIKSLVTSPLDVNTGTWGLSLLKLQANLPDTLPGQNVTFLVFGDTTIDNASGDMHSFYFTSGLGSLNCQEVPRDGIVVRSPQNTAVTFTANGVQITIGSTIVLHAERNKTMSVSLVEGHAQLSTSAGSRTLRPGEVSTVTLGGPNGLTAIDAPSPPTPSGNDPALAPILPVANQLANRNVPVNVAIDGCISEISGNVVIMNGYQIEMGNDPTLNKAKVGDCVHIEATSNPSGNNLTPVVVVKAQAEVQTDGQAEVNNASPGGKPPAPESQGDGKGKPTKGSDDNKAGKGDNDGKSHGNSDKDRKNENKGKDGH